MFLKNLQNLPVRTRKIILWSAVVCLGLPLLFWWGRSAQEKLNSLRGGEFIERLDFPELKMPQVELPTGELKDKTKELEELIKNAQEENSTTTE